MRILEEGGGALARGGDVETIADANIEARRTMEDGSSTVAIVLSTLAAILTIAVALLAFYLCRRHRRRRKRGEVVHCDDVDGDDETEGLRDAMEGLVDTKTVVGTSSPAAVVPERTNTGGHSITGSAGRATSGGVGGLSGVSAGVGKWGALREGGGGGLGGGMGSLAAGVGGGLNALGSRFMHNGILNIKTPLISTKTLGAQLETAGGLPGKATAAGPGASTSIPEGKLQGAGAGGAGGAGVGAAGAVGPAAGAGGPGGSPGGAGGAQNKALANVKGEHPSSRSISLVDMYIDNSEPSENVGQIHFSLEYDFQNTTLILRILQGKELPAKDLSGTSDPYVRVTLLPDKKHRLETKIKRRTLNPRWNETFYFEGFPIQKLQSRVLHLHVFDYDRFSRDDSIGEVFLPLCQVDLSEKPSFWKALKPPAKDKCGELLTSLCYHPSNSILTLTLLKARNLKAKDINGKSDPYVKVWLQFGEKRIEKRKTPIFKCTLNPVFNETFSFNVPWEKIRECSLDVMVMDFDNIGRNELIGRILLAGKNGSGASETKHWQDMITKPRQTIVQWHRLKPE